MLRLLFLVHILLSHQAEKKDTKIKKIYIFLRLGTICATCRVTGYPYSHMILKQSLKYRVLLRLLLEKILNYKLVRV